MQLLNSTTVYTSFYAALSTAIHKMLIKYFGNIFLLNKIISNIVSGNLFPGTY